MHCLLQEWSKPVGGAESSGKLCLCGRQSSVQLQHLDSRFARCVSVYVPCCMCSLHNASVPTKGHEHEMRRVAKHYACARISTCEHICTSTWQQHKWALETVGALTKTHWRECTQQMHQGAGAFMYRLKLENIGTSTGTH